MVIKHYYQVCELNYFAFYSEFKITKKQIQAIIILNRYNILLFILYYNYKLVNINAYHWFFFSFYCIFEESFIELGQI